MQCSFCHQESSVKERTWKDIKSREFCFIHLSCGHTMTEPGLSRQRYDDIESRDHERPFKYQAVEGPGGQLSSADFARQARFRCIFTHEMGVGKMIISVILLVKHLDEVQPVMIVCKSTIMVQWAKKIASWVGVPCQVIDTGKDLPLWGIAKVIIISYDLLRRIKWLEEANKNVKMLIIDEVQNVKNHDAKRTQKIMELAQGVKYIIGLSGTPIKNHGREYGPILMMVRPDKFKSQAGYERDWVSPSGSIYSIEKFKEFTKDFIQRFTRKEVLPDIPEITRQYEYHVMTEEVEAAYQATLEEFTEFMEHTGMSSFKGYGEGLAYLSKMRHLTGLAKVGPVTEYVDDFLSTGDDKIAVFVHHKDVAQLLMNNLAAWKPLSLHSGLDKDQREAVVQEFWKPENRLFIIATLVGGEGINLQCAAHLVMAERQWNPANEEQAEARFPRPGQKSDKILAMYPVAVGTVDELFARLVEKKRQICTEIVDGKPAISWVETDVVREIANITAQEGMKAWRSR